jgi:peroxiredoxin
MTSINLEELLARENPVLDPEEVRLSGDDVKSRCAAILEGTRAMPTTMPVRQRPSGARPSTTRLRPALAFAAGLILILAAVGSVALWAGGSGVGPVDDPTATTQALPSTTIPPKATTVPPGPVTPITAPAYSDMPSFLGVVQYSQHDPASGDPGWQATIEISYAGPLRYEATVIEESGGYLALLGPGTVFFGDGTTLWLAESADVDPWSVGYEPFRHLFFNAEQPGQSWNEICSKNQTTIGTDVVAGRTTTHLACSSVLEDYELWIDEESGLVLKMMGPLEQGDLTPVLDRDGVWHFTEITYESVVTPSAPLVPSYDQSFPPYHLVVTEGDGVFSRTLAIWYLDDATTRETYIDASDPEMVDTFTLIADGNRSDCLTSEHSCHSYPIDADDPWDTTLSTPQLPIALAEEHCSEGAEDVVVGRSTRHFTCDGVSFMFDGAWRVGNSSDAAASEYWYDKETGLVLKQIHHDANWLREAVLLDINPIFPDGIFEYEPMEFPDNQSGIATGDAAPLWNGPLVGGGEFDMADHRGEQSDASFVILYDWFPGCGDVCTENLVEFQRLYETHGTNDRVTFVTVSEDTEAETSRAMDRLDINVLTVHCGWEPDAVCLPDSPWTLWRNGVPSVTVVDPNGEVVDVFMRPPIDDDLRDLLESITGRS